MREGDIILGLFYSNEDNLIYDKIKNTQEISKERANQIKSLSLKFMGPLFMTMTSEDENIWRIELIESSLSLLQKKSFNADIMQTFFILNSMQKTSEGLTYLSGMVGSPYAEDIKMFYDKLDNYIHPSINQGKIVNESIFGGDFNKDKYTQQEIRRGLEFLNYSIGTSRKLHWEESQRYYCVAVLERTTGNGTDKTNLYTLDEHSVLRKEMLNHIPSYYLISILPDYYEKLIQNTLEIFEKTSIFPNIRIINIRKLDERLIYLEEFRQDNGIKKSIGVFIIPLNREDLITEKISYFRKKLRTILDRNKHLEDELFDLNADIDNKTWSTNTEEALEEIKNKLDNTE